MSDCLRKFREIYWSCESDFEPYPHWKTYYLHRYIDFLAFYKKFPAKKFEKVLEIGCGGGYHTAFLSQITKKVIAIDLETPKAKEFTPGLIGAKRLLDHLGINNVELVAASAENLPFENESFDMVYSCYCLEHVPDKYKTIKEINRVLKYGGINFCVVPTSVDRFYQFFSYYKYLIERTFWHLIWKRMKNNSNKNIKSTEGLAKIIQTKSVFENFPFPPTHGGASHYLNELFGWRPGFWKKVVTLDDQVQLLSFSTTEIFFPISALLSVFSKKLSDQFFAWSWKVCESLGRLPIIKYSGINGVFITKK